MAKNEIELGFPIEDIMHKQLMEVRITIKSEANPDLAVHLSRKFLNAATEVQNQLISTRPIQTSSSSS